MAAMVTNMPQLNNAISHILLYRGMAALKSIGIGIAIK
jgi:hypothetical protein